MSQSRLREILSLKITEYLTSPTDNPPPADDKFKTRFASIFQHSGSEGRKRAQRYQAIIDRTVDDDHLLAGRVLDDIKNSSSVLSSSTKLRKRLLEGLVAFYLISPEAVGSKKAELRSADLNMLRHTTPYASLHLRSDDVLYRDAMASLVEPAIIKAISENRVSAAIGNSAL